MSSADKVVVAAGTGLLADFVRGYGADELSAAVIEALPAAMERLQLPVPEALVHAGQGLAGEQVFSARCELIEVCWQAETAVVEHDVDASSTDWVVGGAHSLGLREGDVVQVSVTDEPSVVAFRWLAPTTLEGLAFQQRCTGASDPPAQALETFFQDIYARQWYVHANGFRRQILTHRLTSCVVQYSLSPNQGEQ